MAIYCVTYGGSIETYSDDKENEIKKNKYKKVTKDEKTADEEADRILRGSGKTK